MLLRHSELLTYLKETYLEKFAFRPVVDASPGWFQSCSIRGEGSNPLNSSHFGMRINIAAAEYIIPTPGSFPY